nr:MAG TPA: hypothetical protein [Crassvirales sp.]
MPEYATRNSLSGLFLAYSYKSCICYVIYSLVLDGCIDLVKSFVIIAYDCP